MKNIQLLAVVGPSAVGKTTIIKELVDKYENIQLVLDETTRQPRHNEKDGVDFLFKNKEEVVNGIKQGRLVQVALGPNGDLYCTHDSSYPRQGIGVIPLVPAAVDQFRKLPIKSFKAVFIVPSEYDIWQGWLKKQTEESGWSQEQVKGRIKEAKKNLEFALGDQKIQFILNDGIERAVARIMQVAQGGSPDNEQQAHAAAQKNYDRLKKELM